MTKPRNSANAKANAAINAALQSNVGAQLLADTNVSNAPLLTDAEIALAEANAISAETPIAAIGSNNANSVMSAKAYIRQLLSANDANGKAQQLSIAELCAASKKTEVNVRTMLSDLRNAKYAGKAGVFKTISVRGTDGITRYQRAAE